jgi:hypothetical protein
LKLLDGASSSDRKSARLVPERITLSSKISVNKSSGITV